MSTGSGLPSPESRHGGRLGHGGGGAAFIIGIVGICSLALSIRTGRSLKRRGGLVERGPDFDGRLLVVGHDGDRALGLGVERAGQQSVAGERGDRRRGKLGRAAQLTDERHGVMHERKRCLGRICDHGGTGDGARMVQHGGGLGGAKINKALVAGTFDHALGGLAGGGVNIHGHDAYRRSRAAASRSRASASSCSHRAASCSCQPSKPQRSRAAPGARSVRMFTASSNRPPPAHEASISVGRASFS